MPTPAPQIDLARIYRQMPTPAGLLAGGHIVDVNAAMATLFACAPEKLLGLTIADVVAPEDREIVARRYAARLRGEPVTSSYELRILAFDGNRKRVELTAHALDEVHSLAMLRELRSSPESELVAKLAEASYRVQRARAGADVLREATEAMRALGFRAFFSRFEKDVLTVIPTDPSDPLLALFEAMSGQPVGTIRQPAREIQQTLQQYADRARFLDDFPEMVRRYLRSTGFDPAPMEPALRSPEIARGIVAQLVVGQRPWGTMTVVGPKLVPEDASALGLFASQVASALEVAESLESLRVTNRQLAAVHAAADAGVETDFQRLISRLLRIAVDGTGSDRATIWLVEGKELVRVAAEGFTSGYLEKLSRTGRGNASAVSQTIDGEAPRALSVAELASPLREDLALEGAAQLAVLPLRSEGRRVGVLTVFRDGDRPFSAADLRGGELICNQVAIQIEKAKLIEAERRRVHDLQLLLDVGRLITASLDPDEILEAAAANIARLVDATDAFVWLFDPLTRTLSGAATSTPEYSAHFRTVRVRLGEQSTAAGEALLTRRPVRVVEAEQSTVINRDLNATYRVKSLVALPLLLRDEPIGAVTIGDRFRVRAWSHEEVERATVVANQVAVAVANARLFEDLKRSYDTLARTQEELVKRERLAALGELSAVVAHEVRNPLGVIFNSLGSLRRAVRGNADAEMLMAIVGEEADRLNRIVSDLLDFARPNEPNLRVEGLLGVVESAREASLALTGGTVAIRLELSPRLPPLPLDARMMRQALLNLLVNAVQASARGGEVVLRAEVEGRTMRLEVSDSGPGIPAAHRPRIFQPFFTTKATGTGLGLAVVKRIVEAHRGEVSLQTSEQGTTFTLLLPLEPAELSAVN